VLCHIKLFYDKTTYQRLFFSNYEHVGMSSSFDSILATYRTNCAKSDWLPTSHLKFKCKHFVGGRCQPKGQFPKGGKSLESRYAVVRHRSRKYRQTNISHLLKFRKSLTLKFCVAIFCVFCISLVVGSVDSTSKVPSHSKSF